MKPANRRAVIVGLFILIGLAILTATVLILGGQKKSFVKTITVRAVFNDVAGLQPGSNIWFSGVKIGTVRRISFHGLSQVLVELHIEKSAQSHIRRDAKAKIGSDGLIGNKIVVIYGGTNAAAQVANGDMLQVDKAVSNDEMLATLQNNNRNLEEITGNLKLVSQKIANGEGTLGKLMNDTSLMVNLNKVVGNFRQVSLTSEAVMKDLSAFTAKLNNEGTLMNDLVSDTIIFNNLRGTVTQLRDAAYNASLITENLQAASEQINEGDGPVSTLLYDKKTAEQLKATIHNLQTSSQKLDENLEALQHNFLLRGFFKKKRKAEAEQK
ncbi:MlaD family protein [Foetidibacter luteolus]|uniref:MlaD family protein n=1 Tax=Foetidibacter luteolus TaxID=2608880 RepID=UPI00129B4AA9|nr:MlaD family protein [Foetidibacter luteolus]